MGITRITEGHMSNTSTGMHLTANDGNYEFHASGKNQWQGDEDGIVEGPYKPANKADTLSNSINVSLNLFFDGTQNNKTNTEARNKNSRNHQAYQAVGNKNDDSFENDYTNVARGFDAIDPNAENQVAVYIEGIGTQDLESDTTIPGVATGQGDTGVPAKVTKGCLDAVAQMQKKGYAGKYIDILYVNVYGFSRGSAAARHFIYVASKKAMYEKRIAWGSDKKKYRIFPDYVFNGTEYYKKTTFDVFAEDSSFIDKYGYFGACLLSKEMKIKEIRFNFVGIYDTVASFGPYHGNDVSDLHLDSVSKAKYVFHLASDDEYRENFDLSNIKSAGLRGFELKLPGVHSDIGGSYLNDVEEISVIDNIESINDPEQRRVSQLVRDERYDKFKQIVVEEAWFTDPQLKKEFFYEKDLDKFTSAVANQFNYGLVGRRRLFNTYDKIPLQLMVSQSKQFDVKYTDRMLKNNAIHDDFIHQIYNGITKYVNACSSLRNKYVSSYNNGKQSFRELSDAYYQDLQKISHISYIPPGDLKTLRNKFLHWSVKSNLFGLEARKGKAGPLQQEKRKREIHNG